MRSETPPNLCLIGAGNMGGALLNGWLGPERNGDMRPVVLDPHASDTIEGLNESGLIDLNPPMQDIAPDVVIIAVKPQVLAEVLEPLAFLKGTNALVVSVAAGKKIEFLKEKLGPDVSIVRAMPNVPAAIGLGVTVACASREVSNDQKQMTQYLLEAVGKVAWVSRESDLNAVTALSGSGPAYIFLMIEALANAGIEEGLEAGLAMTLAIETVRGAGQLAAISDLDVATLRKNVTSPGGTTAAALDVLMGEGSLSQLIRTAVKAATQRSKDLG